VTELSGRVAVVTGAGSGIGRASAVALAAAGATVVCADVDGAAAEATASGIGEQGRSAQVDVSRAAEVDDLIEGAYREHGSLDVLVNNAGIMHEQLVADVSDEELDRVLAINLKGVFFGCRAAARVMREGGRLIFTGSVLGERPREGLAAYSASKAGLVGLAKGLALDLASAGITVNVVAPGLIDTDMTRALAGDTIRDWSDRIPLGRLGTPEDVAAAVCFLASDEASYITGHVLAVNGGMYT